MEMNIVIAGEAGQGAFSVELELTETLSRLNSHFFATKNYMSRVRGGHNFSYDPYRRSPRPCAQRGKMGHGRRPGRGDGEAAQTEPP